MPEPDRQALLTMLTTEHLTLQGVARHDGEEVLLPSPARERR